jgi:DNA polymerase I
MMHKLALSMLARVFQSAGNRLVEKTPGFRTTHHPIHDSDSGESLHIDTEKGSWHCWSCGQGGGIVAAVKSLYTSEAKEAEAWLREHLPLSVERLAEEKALPEAFLRQCGLVDLEPGVVGIPYCDQAGKTLHTKRRTAYTASLGSQWPNDTETMVYGLKTLATAREKGFVVLVEGESDQWTLRYHGFPSLGIPGASNVKTLNASHLEGIRTIYVWKETDGAGAGFVERVGKRLEALGWEGEAKVISAPKIKDPSLLHKRNPQEFQAAFQAILKAATLLRPKDVWKRIKTAPQFLAEPDPEFAGIAKDLVVPQAITVMVSPRGLCKTQTTLSLAVALARGTTFRGERLQPTRVLLLDRDNPTRYFKRSLRGWGGELADRLHVLGREDAPLLTQLSAWDELPAENYDVVIIDSMNSFLEGVTEKEGKALSEAMGALRTLAYRGPGVLLLGNTIKDGTVYKGRGEIADMVDILYEVRDATDFVPSMKKPWCEELEDFLPSGDSAWAKRAMRRKGRTDYRLAFSASKFRVGESPEPFCLEIRFPLDSPWTVEDVTEQLMQAGETAKAAAEQEQQETLDHAAHALLVLVKKQEAEGNPLSKTEAEEFLCDDQELKRKDARHLIRAKENHLWSISSRASAGGRPRQVLMTISPEADESSCQAPPTEESFGGEKSEVLEPSSGNGLEGGLSAAFDGSERQKVSPCIHWETSSVEAETFRRRDSVSPDLEPATVFDGHDVDEVVLANGMFHQFKISFPSTILNGLMTGQAFRLSSLPVENDQPEPDSPQPSAEPLSSPSIEVGASYDVSPYTYMTEPAQLEVALPKILEAKTIGVDVETTGLKHRVDRACLIQLATPDHTYLINAATVPPAMLAPMMTGDRWLIAQNLKFDLQMLVKAGLPWPDTSVRLLDTMLCAQVLDADHRHPGRHPSSLEAIAEQFLGTTLDKAMQTSDWTRSLSTEQLVYAARDAQILLPLAEKLRSELHEERLWATARLESAGAAALAWIELAGLPVDVDQWHTLGEQLSQQAQALRQEVSAIAGRSINWNSHKQVVNLLSARGIPVKSSAADALSLYVSDDVVEAFLKYKHVFDTSKTFGLKWLRHVDRSTNRVYAEFYSIGSGVGRTSCTEPNLQNIPHREEFRSKVRGTEGRWIVKADYSQLHLRLVAELAPEPAMREAYARGADLHIVTAARLLNINETAVSRQQRNYAKPFNFGTLYLMGIDRFRTEAWSTYGVRLSEAEAREMQAKWYQLYPGIERWQDREKYALEHDGITEVRSLLGRRRKGMTRAPDRLSSLILTIEADGVKQALVNLFTHRGEVPSARVVSVIHDEILVECDVGQVEAVSEWLRAHMEAGMQAAFKGKARTPVEVGDGPSWGETKQR